MKNNAEIASISRLLSLENKDDTCAQSPITLGCESRQGLASIVGDVIKSTAIFVEISLAANVDTLSMEHLRMAFEIDVAKPWAQGRTVSWR